MSTATNNSSTSIDNLTTPSCSFQAYSSTILYILAKRFCIQCAKFFITNLATVCLTCLSSKRCKRCSNNWSKCPLVSFQPVFAMSSIANYLQCSCKYCLMLAYLKTSYLAFLTIYAFTYSTTTTVLTVASYIFRTQVKIYIYYCCKKSALSTMLLYKVSIAKQPFFV